MSLQVILKQPRMPVRMMASPGTTDLPVRTKSLCREHTTCHNMFLSELNKSIFGKKLGSCHILKGLVCTYDREK